MEIGKEYCLNASTSTYPAGTKCILTGVDGTTCIVTINGGKQVVSCDILSVCQFTSLLGEPLITLNGREILAKGVSVEVLEKKGSYAKIKTSVSNRRYWIPTSILGQ